MRLLLVEDNATLADWLCRTLRKSHYLVDWLSNGAEADMVLRSKRYDLVVLDLSLPSMDGEGVLQAMRARSDSTPVLVLTANSSLGSRVKALDLGADDFVGKPFEVEELEARIRALLRRRTKMAMPSAVCGRLHFDANSRTFDVDGVSLELTPRERALLEMLILDAGKTLARPKLIQGLSSVDSPISTDALDLHIHRLRRKLEGSDSTIVTLRGLGFILKVAHAAL
ncbi:MAG: response regulator transcription factor [Variovorax sp.]